MNRLIKSFAYAFNGWVTFFKTEANGQIHLVVAIFVISASFYFKLNSTEWIIILLCIGAVIAFEMVNSAIEKLCDLITTEKRPEIKFIKDVAAGAVLFVSVVAVIIGLIIFASKF